MSSELHALQLLGLQLEEEYGHFLAVIIAISWNHGLYFLMHLYKNLRVWYILSRLHVSHREQ